MPEEVDEDGLIAVEREYLTAPFSKLNEEQRRQAMAIKEKQITNRWAVKDSERRQAQEESEKRFA